MEKQMAKKLVTSHTFTGTSPNPESPPLLGSEDGRAIGNLKGWYSERVPDSSYRVRKGYVAAAALVPFSSGRALPSKWDDAERWISSPVSVGNVSTSSNNYYCGTGVHNKASHLAYNSQRRAKSKSGPLGPAGLGFYGSPNYNTFSPVLGMGVINGEKWRNSIAVESPAEAGVRLEERLDGGGGGDDGRRRSCPGHGDPEWLDLWSGPLSPSDKGDMNMPNDAMESINNDDDDGNNNYTDSYNDDARVDRAISRRDMATQMYPDSDSSCPSYAMSSPRSSISTGSPCRLLNQPNNSAQSFEFEVRDVQIDRQSSRATQRRPTSTSPKENEVSENSSCTTIVNEDNKMLKLQREEARINAWENLQKAKAESAIQKLEMKLEKKRATSMEKIIKKLRRAEIKAQNMKGSLDDHGSDCVQNRAISENSSKIPSFCRKFRLIKSCSTCYLF